MMKIIAPAKINLTLSITGRNETNYHQLISAVCFTDFGDKLMITPTKKTSHTILSGPFAAALEEAGGDHLIASAYNIARQIRADIDAYQVQIEKHIPLGGGLGGGSADAAAFLRALSAQWSDDEKRTLRSHLATLGADVPACFDNQMHVMTQAIDMPLSPLLPKDHHDKDEGQEKRPIMVITNPLIHADTASVFAAYAQSNKSYSDIETQTVTHLLHQGAWQDLLEIGNDLTAAACQIYPQIDMLLNEMSQSHMMGKQDLLGTAMSGSGASCFALLSDDDAAQAYVRMLENKGIWCQKTRFF